MSTRKSRNRSMMGIASPTGSHLPILQATMDSLQPGDLVLEHGAGLYSTPLLATYADVRILCHEPHEAWAEWASWIYDGRAEMATDLSQTIARLKDVAVAFLDGPAKERGVLLHECLAASVPTIIVHDTNKREWRFYDFTPEMFQHERYEVTHHAEDSHRTTMWRLK